MGANNVDIVFRLLGNESGFKQAMRSAQGDAASLSQKMKMVGLQMQKVGRTMTLGVTAPIVAGMGLAVKSASDLGESMNAVNVTFGKSAKGIKKLANEAATSVGLTATQFNGLAIQFANFAQTVAGPGGDVVKTMDDLTTRAADFASVMNIDVAKAAEIFQSGLAGESEPLRKYGIDVSAAAVETYAWAKGIAKTGEKLTEQQKVQARYGLIMEQTKKTQGDFANTSDSLANKSRILKAQLGNVSAELGSVLLPTIEKVTAWVGKLVKWVADLSPKWKDFAVKVALVVAAIGPALFIGGKLLVLFSGMKTLIGGVNVAFRLLSTVFLTSPIGWVALAIAGLVAVFILLWKKCDSFRNFWIAVWEKVKAAAAAVWPVIKAVGEKIVEALQWVWETVSAGVSAFWDWAGPFITFQVAVWWEAIQLAASWIITSITELWNAVSTAVRWFWGWAGPFITESVQAWWVIIKATFNAIKKVFEVVWPIIVDVVRGAIENIKRIIATIETVIAVIQAVWNAVKKGATAAWSVATGIAGVVSDGLRTIRDLPGDWLDRIKAAVGKIWTSVKNAASTAWDSITGVVGDAFGRIRDYANNVIKAINWVIVKLNDLAHTNIGTIGLFRGGLMDNGGGGGSAPVSTPAIMDNGGMGAAGPGKGGITSGGTDVVSWMTDLWDKYGIGSKLPSPTGGLFGNGTSAIYELAKNAIMDLLKKYGGGSGQQIVDFAKSRLGDPYVWGGTSPGGFDCSGLIYWAYQQAGKSWFPRIPGRSSLGRQIPYGQARPADVMFYNPGAIQDGVRVPFGHFKMYAGGGKTIESTSGGVQMRPYDGAASQIRTYLAKGGIARGSASGYPAVLHSEEAVLPLADPRAMAKLREGLGTGYQDNRRINLYVQAAPNGRVDVKALWREINAIEGKATRAARRGKVRG